jgi:hypothetical protein
VTHSGLLCKFGACHKACVKSVDCATGERCVQVDGVAVCQLANEAACGVNFTCSSPLACRQADNTCRNGCTPTGNECLADQTCSGGFCVEFGEADAGQGGDSGTGGGPDACVDAGGGDTAAADVPIAAQDVMPSRDAGTAASDTRKGPSDAPRLQDAAGTEVGTKAADAEQVDGPTTGPAFDPPTG